MSYAGLDLSRKRLDFHLLDAEGTTVEVGAAAPDADGLHRLTRRLERRSCSRSAGRSRTSAPSQSRSPACTCGVQELGPA
jgi:hypothetical protein